MVFVDDIGSKEVLVTSGVPEGSHLGPPIFLLYVNDIPDILSYCKCLLFADDIKFYAVISNLADCLLMQNDLNKFFNWCIANDLKLNLEKCSSMSYNRSLFPIIPMYTFDNVQLKVVHEINDLGVIFDEKLTFHYHINSIVSKANSLLGFLKRNSFEFKDPYTLRSLFHSIVRPSLEYACVVWNPTSQSEISKIERVQKNFLRFALRSYTRSVHYSNFSYRTKCLFLGMQSLELRREMYSVMFVRDVLSSFIDCSSLLFKFNVYAPSRALRLRPLLFEAPHRTNYGMREPITHSCRLFNEVYYYVDISMGRNTFKHLLLAYIVHKFNNNI